MTAAEALHLAARAPRLAIRAADVARVLASSPLASIRTGVARTRFPKDFQP